MTISQKDLVGFFYELSFNISPNDCQDFINSISLDDKSAVNFEEFDKIVMFSLQLQAKRRKRGEAKLGRD